jgi:hypothetical protein
MTAFDDRGVLQTTVELKYDGEWHDITQDVNAADDIVITRGRSDEASHVDTSSCTFRLNNTDGKYSPRNPNSPLYGKIGRNTPIRVRLPYDNEGVDLPGLVGSYVYTPDTASLDTTGDLDIRMEIEPESWRPAESMILASKWPSFTSADPGSWFMHLQNTGNLELTWSPTGTLSGRIALRSSVTVPSSSSQLSVRATLDVDNGSGQSVVTYYTAPSISGPWTQLGSPVTHSGTTSVFSSSQQLTIGAAAGGNIIFSATIPFSGKVFSLELYDRIGGDLVASPVFDTDPEDTSFTDSVGLVWSLVGSAHVPDPGVRFRGSVSAWPTRWDVPDYASVPVEANGILRRLGQGTSLRSAMVRGIMGAGFPTPRAYWTCEGGKDSVLYGSEPSDGYVMKIEGPVKPASYTDFDCSDALPSIGAGLLFGTLRDYPVAKYLRVMALVHVPDTGVQAKARLMRIVTTGDITDWVLELTPEGSLILTGSSGDRTGVPIVESNTIAFDLNGYRSAVGLFLTQNGSNIDWNVFAYKVGDSATHAVALTVNGHTFGVCRNVTIGGIQDLGDTAVGHVVVLDNDEFFKMEDFINAWALDSANDRMIRLCGEEHVPLVADVTSEGTEPVGAQRVGGFVDLVQEAADADEGILYEPRDTDGLAFRTRASMYDQTAKLALDYAAGHIADGFDPTDDDQTLRNDVTVSRTEGSSARSVEEVGPVSVLEPPFGVGRYTDAITLNVGTDDQLPNHAGWRRHLGTVDEFRFPKVHVCLNGNPELIEDAMSVDIGDRITISNLPAWMPPGSVKQLVQGYTETLNTFTWDLVFNCTPASPWNTGHVEDLVYGRADTELSETTHDATDSATSIDVFTKMGEALWTTKPEEFPFDIDAAGEQVTVSAVTSKVVDEFARTVSGGWGSADTGQAWALLGGTSSAYSVNGSSGLISLASVNTPVGAIAEVTSADMDQTVTFKVPAKASGAHGWIVYGLMARYQDPTNCYTARAEFKETGNWGISLYRGIGSGESFINGAELGTYVAGDKFTLRLKINDSRIRADLWKVTTAQPIVWRFDLDDTRVVGIGDAGVFATLLTGNTNTRPVTATFDRYEVANPQKFTVTRSVNGIVKALPARSNVRILNPATVAL